jgi:hypothetical protein
MGGARSKEGREEKCTENEVGNLKRRKLERPRRRWENNIRIDVK